MQHFNWIKASITFVVVFALLQFADRVHAFPITATEGQLAVLAFALYLLGKGLYRIGQSSRQKEIDFLRGVVGGRDSTIEALRSMVERRDEDLRAAKGRP